MSLLLSPFVLFALGLGVARMAKSRRVWRRHSRFPRVAVSWILGVYTVLGLGLFVNHPALSGLVRWLPGETGTQWMVNSGVFSFEASWSLADPGVVVACVVGFMSFPLWLYLGLTTGYWLFGTNPRQTGILGLLR